MFPKLPRISTSCCTSEMVVDEMFWAKYVSGDQLNFTPATVFTWIIQHAPAPANKPTNYNSTWVTTSPVPVRMNK